MAKTRTHDPLVAKARHVMSKVYLPRIESCLKALSAQQIWWRPNNACNSIGNLVLHLAGNVRQWIVSGLGGEPDHRRRELEFSERGPLPRSALITRLRQTVRDACRALDGLTDDGLTGAHTIQGFQVTGHDAIFHVAEHFSHHAGQIILMTKMLTGNDLKFTRLPGEDKRKRQKVRNLPAL